MIFVFLHLLFLSDLVGAMHVNCISGSQCVAQIPRVSFNDLTYMYAKNAPFGPSGQPLTPPSADNDWEGSAVGCANQGIIQQGDNGPFQYNYCCPDTLGTTPMMAWDQGYGCTCYDQVEKPSNIHPSPACQASHKYPPPCLTECSTR
jgi:hypothetical protein